MDSDPHDQTSHQPLLLPRSLNAAQVTELSEALLSRRGSALQIDASDVEHLGGLCLQLLIAARNTWSADGAAFEISRPSDAIVRDLALLGCPIESLRNEGGRA